MEFIDWHWPTALIVLILVLFVVIILAIILMKRTSQYSILQILTSKDGEHVREGVKIVLMASAAAMGGLWVAYNFVVTGTAKLSEIQLNKAKWETVPGPSISYFKTEVMPYGQSDVVHKYALHVEVEIENKSYQDVQLSLQDAPLLLISKVKDELTDQIHQNVELDKHSILSPPFLKIKDFHGKRSIDKWNTIILEPEAKQKLLFLQPSLDAGLYYIQFQLIIPQEVANTTLKMGSSKDIDNTQSFFAAQNAYVRIPAELDDKGPNKKVTLEVQKPKKSKSVP